MHDDAFSDGGAAAPAPVAVDPLAVPPAAGARAARAARRHAPPPDARFSVPAGQHDVGQQLECPKCHAMVWPDEYDNGKCCKDGQRVLDVNHNPPLDGTDAKSVRYRELLTHRRIGPVSRAANHQSSFTSMGTVPNKKNGGHGFEYQSDKRPAVLHVHGKTYHVFVPVDRDGPMTRLAADRTQAARSALGLPSVFVVDGCEAACGGEQPVRAARDEQLIKAVRDFIRDTNPMVLKYVALMDTSASMQAAPPTHIRFHTGTAPTKGSQVEVALVAAGVEAPAEQRVLLTAVAEHRAASRAAAGGGAAGGGAAGGGAAGGGAAGGGAAGGGAAAAGSAADDREAAGSGAAGGGAAGGGAAAAGSAADDRGVKWTYVHNSSVLYELLQYPMLYENATGGWCKGVHAKKVGGKARQLTLHKYVKSMLFQNKRLHYLTRLSCEWVLDMWSRNEELDLGVVRKLKRVQKFGSYRAVRRRDVDVPGAGRESYLPASRPGSKKFLNNLIADGVARTTRKGNPTFFVTITANPAWPEIRRALLPGRRASGKTWWRACLQ